MSAALNVVPPAATAAQVQARLGAAGATVDEDVARQLLAQLAGLGLVRITRRGSDGAGTFVTTSLGRTVIDAGLGGATAVSLAQLEALRTDLVSTIAHELRTPLTAVRTSIGLLLDPATRATDAQHETLLRSIQRNADRMQRLIADVLDLSRFRAGTVALQLRQFRSVALAKGAISVVAPLAAQRSVEIALETQLAEGHEVFGDRRRLEQALLNLLSNAVKFSPDGGTVQVCVEERDEMTAWTVADTGPGINADDQTRLFERFFVGRSDSNGEGVGLGLPTALAIAQAHSGSIEVDSQIGRGSTFALVVPTGGPEEPPG